MCTEVWLNISPEATGENAFHQQMHFGNCYIRTQIRTTFICLFRIQAGTVLSTGCSVVPKANGSLILTAYR